MRPNPVVAILFALLVLSQPALAQGGKKDAPRDELWDACNALLDRDDNWIGWRRDFGGGYTDSFRFVDGSFDASPSVLQETRLIDAIAWLEEIWCFDETGALASIAITMGSPNMADGGEMGPGITREGRVTVRSGEIVDVTGWIADFEGKVLGPLSDERYLLARDCPTVDLHPTIETVIAEYESVLGDIYGERPAYVTNEVDWCAMARPGP